MSFAAVRGFPRRVINPIAFANVTSSPGGGGTTTWVLSFTSAGMLTFTSSDNAGFNTIQSTEWYIPAQTGVGSGHYVRLTITAGTSPDAGDAVSSWLHLSATKSWTWTRTTIGTTNATATVEIADDSGGTNIIGTKTGTTLTLEKGS